MFGEGVCSIISAASNYKNKSNYFTCGSPEIIIILLCILSVSLSLTHYSNVVLLWAGLVLLRCIRCSYVYRLVIHLKYMMVKLYLRVPYIQLDPTAILSMQEPVPTVVELQPATAMTIKPAKTPVMASTSNSPSPPLLPMFMFSFSSHSSC